MVNVELERSVCVFVRAYLGRPVPQAVHGYSCAVVRVSHIDDRLSDGLDHLLLAPQQTSERKNSAVFSSWKDQRFPGFLTVLCLSGANVKKSRKTLWTRECLITCSLQQNSELFHTIIGEKHKSRKRKCGCSQPDVWSRMLDFTDT